MPSIKFFVAYEDDDTFRFIGLHVAVVDDRFIIQGVPETCTKAQSFDAS